MIFYCYSEIGDSTIASRLGEADYSYYFVLKAYLPLLESLGTVKIVDSLGDELESECAADISAGETCFLFAFAPPHKVSVSLPCPVIPVFAWEYSSIPNRKFIDDPKDSWSTTLRDFGQALTHSSYARNVVKNDIDANFLIESIPAPLWDSCASLRSFAAQRPAVKDELITFGTTVIDSREFDITTDTIAPAEDITQAIGPGDVAPGMGRNINIDFSQASSDIMMIGFYGPEGWGSWSRSASPWIMLPSAVSGKVRIQLSANAYGKNISRPVQMRIGDQSITLDLTAEIKDYEFEIEVKQASNFVCIGNIDNTDERTMVDPRSIGIGLARLSIENADTRGANEVVEPNQNIVEHKIHLTGVVYTTVFNPLDARKNWEDILTAFCLAFKDRGDTTLILKMTYKDMSGYIDDIFDLFRRLHPFDCRVIVVHGFLGDDEYRKLMESTSYVVNASRSEGQCLPLMEYMSSGIPAIAPNNTAMGDYVNAENALVVHSTPEPSFWPHDPLQIYMTLWYRPSWESLFDAYKESYDIAIDDEQRYVSMSREAGSSLREYCSIEVLRERLSHFLNEIEAG